MADDCRETDQQKIDSAINELAERKNGKRTAQYIALLMNYYYFSVDYHF